MIEASMILPDGGVNTQHALWRSVLGLIAAVVFVFAGTEARAQESGLADDAASSLSAEDTSPPDPRDIPAAAFASANAFNDARMSPDGRLFAFVRNAGDKALLSITDTDSLEPVEEISLGAADNFNWFVWAGPRRILTSRMANASSYYYVARFSRLMVYDLDTKEWNYIGLRKQGLEGDDVLWVDPAGSHVLLSLSKREGVAPEVWRFPLDGSGEKNAVRVQKKNGDIHEWFADEAGVVRLGMGWSYIASTMIYYRSGSDEEFRRVTKLRRRDEALDNWDVLRLAAGNDMGLALVDGENGKRVLRELDYNTGELGPVFLELDDWSIDGVVFGNDRQIAGVRYTDDAPHTRWLDPAMAAHQARLEQMFGGGQVRILSQSNDRSRMLVLRSGPADPGTLYVYAPGQESLKRVRKLRPQLDYRALSEPKAVSFAARDGTSIRAFLTLPRTRPGEKRLPLVIMPHGGPYGIRDSLVYNDWVQLLASRGYAVLQPNYRGSGGYGEAFQKLGDGEIGRGMQDDLDDAMDWAVAEGIADPARVCLVGASYGVYAALWGVIRNPERYRCAASYAGVTDWKLMLEHDKNYLARDYYRELKAQVKGDEKGFALSEVSPVRRAKELKRPVLLVQGTLDRVVPMAQFNAMVEAADGVQPPLETLTFKDNHNLADEANELKFYETLLAFLAEQNPADVTADPPPAEAGLSATGG